MFGCVVAGRLVQTAMQQIDATRGIFELPQASKINHICVFLLGTVPFPDGYGAIVHFSWPGKGFQLLGSLSNDKPSAVFRVRGLFASANVPSSMEGQREDVTAVLGVAIATLVEIEQQLATCSPTSDMHWLRPGGRTGETALTLHNSISSADAIELATRLLKSLYDYLLSFSGDTGGGPAIIPGGGTAGAGVGVGGVPQGYMPTHVLTHWIDTTIRKIRSGGIAYLYRSE